jgi:hypothetical protein
MAKIYISYAKADKPLAIAITVRLRTFGHEVAVDENLVPGQDWRRTLSDALKAADVVVALISSNSERSPFVFSELGAARTYAAATNAVLLVPVMVDPIPIPNVIADLQVMFAVNKSPDDIAIQIEEAIAAFIGKRAAEEKASSERKQEVEENAAIYVEDAIQWLRKNERRDRAIGTIWSVLGFIALLTGIGFGFRSMSQAIQAPQFEWIRFAYVALKSIVVIGLLIACCKYAFTLGKTYMAESLKSADRIHAISFGKFYLKAYGDNAKWTDLKEVFEHWNLDKASAFSGLDAGQFDPKFAEFMIEIAKAAATLKGK